MSKPRTKRLAVSFALLVAVAAGSSVVPAAAFAGTTPTTVPGNSSPAPKSSAKKSCPWYKFWC